MRISVLAAALCAGSALLLAAPSALADGMREAAPANARSMTMIAKEKGVSVYRGPRMLAGEAPPPAEAEPPPAADTTKVVVVHHYHSKIRRLRTQGFYSGHPGESRRFTQGFYSGAVDKGRSSHRHCAHG